MPSVPHPDETPNGSAPGLLTFSPQSLRVSPLLKDGHLLHVHTMPVSTASANPVVVLWFFFNCIELPLLEADIFGQHES